MSATLDNEPVAVGDKVFDVCYGPGTVEELLVEDRFRVSFSLNRFVVFNGDGIAARFPRRTLYWHDPVVAAPMKSDEHWGVLASICRSISDNIRTLRTGG